MSTPEPTAQTEVAAANAAVSKAGNQVDAVAKQKVTIDLYVVIAIAIVANLAGVFLHI